MPLESLKFKHKFVTWIDYKNMLLINFDTCNVFVWIYVMWCHIISIVFI